MGRHGRFENFRIDPSLSNRIESERPIRIRIESGSIAGPYLKHAKYLFQRVFRSKVIVYTLTHTLTNCSTRLLKWYIISGIALSMRTDRAGFTACQWWHSGFIVFYFHRSILITLLRVARIRRWPRRPEHICLFPSYSSNPVSAQLHSYALVNGTVQAVDEPTRGNNIIDLVLTNEPFLLSSIAIKPPFSTSDHNTVSFTVQFDYPTHPDRCHPYADTCGSRVITLRCRTTSIWVMRNFDWSDMVSTQFNPDDLRTVICDVLNYAIDLFIPSEQQNRPCIEEVPGLPWVCGSPWVWVWGGYGDDLPSPQTHGDSMGIFNQPEITR